MDGSSYTLLEDGYNFLDAFELDSIEHKHLRQYCNTAIHGGFDLIKIRSLGKQMHLFLYDGSGILQHTKCKRKI